MFVLFYHLKKKQCKYYVTKSVVKQNFQSGAIEIVLPFEEETVEAQKTWIMGKVMGFKMSNELVMIKALFKIKECQDFSLSRKRGCPSKKKGGS